MSDIIAALSRLLTDGGQLIRRPIGKTDKSQLSEAEFLQYGVDRSQGFTANFDILLEPASESEIQAIIRFAREHKLAIVTSGGRTGLSGGAVAASGEIVLSLKRLKNIIKIDESMPSMRAQAGVITAQAIEAARAAGYQFPLDLAASGSSQLGGNVATNAGGIRVIRYGLLRDHVLGLKVVTGTGELLNFPGNIYKNNTGYDLRQLFIGSEGTLGIITEVTIHLLAAPGSPAVALMALQSLKSAYQLLSDLRKQGLRPLAYEYFDAHSVLIVQQHLELPDPLKNSAKKSPLYNHYVLLEWDSREVNQESLMDMLADAISSGLILDASIAQSSSSMKAYWQYREAISESLSMNFFVYKNDISLSARAMPELIERLKLALKQSKSEIQLVVFGHLGDGNLHLNLFQAKESIQEASFRSQIKELEEIVYQLVQEGEGSISAEHGIGLLKKDHLHYSRSRSEVDSMRSIKRIFDPDNILNPGKIF